MSHIEHHLAPPGMKPGNGYSHAVVREIRDRHIDPAQPPASTAVQVVALFRPGYLVEIEALAVVQDVPDDPSAEAN